MVSESEIVKTSRELNSLLIDALRGLRGADACTVSLTEGADRACVPERKSTVTVALSPQVLSRRGWSL